MDALRRLNAWLMVNDAPADIVDDYQAVERRLAGVMIEEGAMDRALAESVARELAEQELRRRYRIRILVSLEHGEHAVQLHASTMVEHAGEIGAGLVGLCELVVPRLTSALEGHPNTGGSADASQVEGAATPDGSGPGTGESGEEDQDRHVGEPARRLRLDQD